jgi:hypothetical protein
MEIWSMHATRTVLMAVTDASCVCILLVYYY